MPPSVIEFNMRTREEKFSRRKKLKIQILITVLQTPLGNGKRWCKVPISLVYRKDLKKEGGNPLLQYGYGSYGHTIDPYFRFQIEFIESRVRFATAHVRGGEYFGTRVV
jgi:oligopeptidase B